MELDYLRKQGKKIIIEVQTLSPAKQWDPMPVGNDSLAVSSITFSEEKMV